MLYATYAMMTLHTFVGVVLIGIILLQRGRGGGLAGAFGGLGGQSAFGNKAGDVFTRITIVLAIVWMVLGCVCVLMASNSRSVRFSGGSSAETGTEIKKAPANEDLPGAGKGAEKDLEGSLPGPENPPKTDTKPDTKLDKPDASADGNTPSKDKEEPKKEEPKKEEGKDAPAAADKKGDTPATLEPDKKPE